MSGCFPNLGCLSLSSPETLRCRRLVKAVFPTRPGDQQASASHLSLLVYYALSHPNSLPALSRCLLSTTQTLANKYRLSHVRVSLDILNALLRECGALHLPLFAHNALSVIHTVFNTNDLDILFQATGSFVLFCSKYNCKDAGEDVHTIYSTLIATFVYSATFSSNDKVLEHRTRLCGLKALQAVSANDSFYADKHVEAYIQQIVSATLFILTSTSATTVDSSSFSNEPNSSSLVRRSKSGDHHHTHPHNHHTKNADVASIASKQASITDDLITSAELLNLSQVILRQLCHSATSAVSLKLLLPCITDYFDKTHIWIGGSVPSSTNTTTTPAHMNTSATARSIMQLLVTSIKPQYLYILTQLLLTRLTQGCEGVGGNGEVDVSILSKPAVRIQHYTIIKILGDLIVSAEEGNGSSSSSDGVKMTTSATTTTTTGGIISTTVLEFLDVFCRRLKANVVYDAQVGVKDRQHGSSSKQHPHHHHNVNGEGVDDVKNGLVELIGSLARCIYYPDQLNDIILFIVNRMSVMDPLSATKTTTTANNIIPTPSSEHDKWLIKALAAILTRRIIAVQDEINRDEADQIDKMEVAVVNEEYEMGGVVDNIGRTGNVLVASAAAAAASKLERRNSIIKNPIKHELVLPLLNYLLADNEETRQNVSMFIYELITLEILEFSSLNSNNNTSPSKSAFYSSIIHKLYRYILSSGNSFKDYSAIYGICSILLMRGGPASAEMVGTILSAEKTAVIVVSDNKKVLLTDAASSTPQLFTGTGTQKRYIGNLVVQIMELVASHWETQELMSLVKAEKAKRIKEKMWEPVAAYSFEPPAGVESVVKVLSPVALVANSPVKRKLSSVIAGSRGDSYNENLFNSSTNALLQSGLAMHLVDLTVHFNIELVVQAITHDAAVSDALRSQIEAMMMTATGIGEFILEISSMSPSLYHQQDEAAAAATTPSNVKSLSPNSSSNKSGRKDANGASAVGTGIVVPAASLHSSSSMSDQLPMAVKVEELKDALSAGNGGISHNNNNGSVRFDSGSGGGGGGGGAVTDLDDADGSGKRAAQEDITALLENIVVDDPSAASSKRETILSNTSGKDIALPLGMMLKAKGTAGENRSLYGSTSSARGKQEPALDSFL